jgi:hypothetical protein
MASVDQLMDVSYCVQGAAVAPIGVRFRLQIGLENRTRQLPPPKARSEKQRRRRAPEPNGPITREGIAEATIGNTKITNGRSTSPIAIASLA